jgi:RimJ/RimL family protein N-acetyltransferase
VHREIDGLDEVEIAYALRREWWGRGLATEAAAAVRDYALGRLGRRRLICLVAPENRRSARVAEKLGMGVDGETLWHGTVHRVYALSR